MNNDIISAVAASVIDGNIPMRDVVRQLRSEGVPPIPPPIQIPVRVNDIVIDDSADQDLRRVPSETDVYDYDDIDLSNFIDDETSINKSISKYIFAYTCTNKIHYFR